MKFVPVLGLAVLTAACPASGRSGPHAVVAKVGDAEITREMLEYREKAFALDPLVRDPELAATVALVHGELALSVGSRFGLSVTEGAVREMWRGAQAVAPEAIRNTYAKSDGSFAALRALVYPEVAATLLARFFEETPDVHVAERERAVRVHAAMLLHPKSFDAIAREEGLEVDRLWIGPGTLRSASAPSAGQVKLEPEAQAAQAPRSYSEAERAQAAEMYESLVAVEKGGVYSRIMMSPDGFQMAKVEDRGKGELLVALALVPKRNLDAWFLDQIEGVPLTFPDHELGLKFIRNVEWARYLLIEKSEFPEVFGGAPTGE